ncbi:PTS glucose transporter subunit IIA [Bacillus atrophaeus]|nr:PTS glucose transporter subunit IIA [Bacillus atrophaeus]
MTPVAGQKVKQEQRLLTFDLNDIKEHAASAITPMIFTNRTEGRDEAHTHELIPL